MSFGELAPLPARAHRVVFSSCRTFATTSIAKKAVPVVEQPVGDQSAASDAAQASSATGPCGLGGGADGGELAAAGNGAGADGAVKKPEEEEWEKETSYLQGLVEKLQDKVDKEVARGYKVSLTDRAHIIVAPPRPPG